jgi:uncharacterized membrane protein
MKSFRLSAAAFLAASIAVLAGCASEQPQQQQTAEASNPCLGVAPATGSIIRRKEDCGAKPSEVISEDLKDAIRRSTPIRPAGGSGG